MYIIRNFGSVETLQNRDNHHLNGKDVITHILQLARLVPQPVAPAVVHITKHPLLHREHRFHTRIMQPPPVEPLQPLFEDAKPLLDYVPRSERDPLRRHSRPVQRPSVPRPTKHQHQWGVCKSSARVSRSGTRHGRLLPA